jgi:DNA-binding protein
MEEKDNKIFIGNKPFMNYVTSVIMQFTSKDADEVIIKSRGKYISRAIDVAEIVVKKFLEKQVVYKDVIIDSELFKNKENKEVRVSTVDIILKKI